MTARTAEMHTADELTHEGNEDDLSAFYFSAASASTPGKKNYVVWNVKARTAACNCFAGEKYTDTGVTCWHMDLAEDAFFAVMLDKLTTPYADDKEKLQEIGKVAAGRVKQYGEFWSLANPLDLLVLNRTRELYAAILHRERKEEARNAESVCIPG